MMTGHPIARYCIHILTFVTPLVAGGRAFAQIESKVLMREDFEGDWAGRADAWDADSSIKFNLDTKVAHSSKASLRLTPEGMSDVCHGNSAKFSGMAGVNYRISFWVKAENFVEISKTDGAKVPVKSFDPHRQLCARSGTRSGRRGG